MSNLICIAMLPLACGLVALLIPRPVRMLAGWLSVAVSGTVLYMAALLFFGRPHLFDIGGVPLLKMDSLSGFVVLFIGLFGFLLSIYSLGFMKNRDDLNRYYGYLLMTVGGSIGSALADNFILFMACWGFVGLMLYLLIGLGGPGASGASKKALVIVGGSDALMLLGVGIIYYLAQTFTMSGLSLPLHNGLAVLAFISLACGAFAKAGAFPLHTWIPDSASVAPVPVMALLPASLDKLLGIYLLARLSMDIFVLAPNTAMSNFLLVVGAVTVIAAVMMALVQHDMKKLLSYHAVSQVGYMVLGIGTANPVGIAGGIFHMVNHALYKSCLFLCGGAIENKKGTTDLDSLGGLSKVMPVTYITCLVAALAISGVPPMNGFASKWMVYQGLVELGKTGSHLWVIWLVAALFGSALTLASFMKLIHAAFLGAQAGPELKKDEVSFSMQLPMAVLASLCVIFGVFAYQIPIRLFIEPSVAVSISYPGFWDAGLSTGLIMAGVIIGLIVYGMSNIRNLRVDEPFIGGEKLTHEMKLSGVAFYKTIEDIPVFSRMYAWASKGYFDIYRQGTAAALFLTRALQRLHNGVLPTYLAWCLIGAIALFFIFMKG